MDGWTDTGRGRATEGREGGRDRKKEREIH